MIGLDTNVLVRYIMQDDAGQAARATTLLEGLSADTPGWISLVSIVELVWVLGAAYDLDRTQVLAALEAVLSTKELKVEHTEQVWRSLRACRSVNADFADCLIASCAASAGCVRVLTFDRGAARLAGMTLVP